MDNKSYQMTIALAGITQAAYLVNHIARGRQLDYAAFETCLDSLFVTSPDTIDAIYGDRTQLILGLRRLTSFFPKPDKTHDNDVARYLIGSILIQRLLHKDQQRLAAIQQNVEALRPKLEQLSISHDSLIADLANIYSQHISQLKRRIQIVGDRKILQTSTEVNRIRALLLAAIRSAVLWQQVGGRLWQLWFKRQAIHNWASELLYHD